MRAEAGISLAHAPRLAAGSMSRTARDAGLNAVFFVPPVSWIVMVRNVSPSTMPVFLLHAADLEHLAAQTDQQHGGNVGIAGVAPLRALQRLETLALGRHAAAGAMDQRDEAVDMGKIAQQARPLRLLRDEARDRSRTVHARQDGDIIARAGFSSSAAKALKRRLQLHRQNLLFAGSFRKPVVAGEIVHHDIMLVQPRARLDRAFREADDLAEFFDRLAIGDGDGRDLVALGHAIARYDAFDPRAGTDDIDRDAAVIDLVQTNGARLGKRERGHGESPGVVMRGLAYREIGVGAGR